MRCTTSPQKLGAKCEVCPFAVDGKPNKPVMGEGPIHPMGVLVGEGPGAEEEAVGRPFVGPTGRKLDDSLLANGIWRNKLFVVNATACRPPANKTEPMMREAVEACRPAFTAQIQLHLDAKRAFIVMGRWAWHAFAGEVPKGGVEDGRGFIRKHPSGSTYLATYHPTFAFFRAPGVWGSFEVDLGKFKRAMTGGLLPRPERIVTNATWREVQKLAREPYLFSCDIETAPETLETPWTGKQPTRARLRTIGFGNPFWGLSLRWETASDRTREAVAKLLRNKRRTILWQNGFWFDHPVLKRHGLEVKAKAEDTRDARRAISATSKLDLGFLATTYDDPPIWWSEGLVTRMPRSEEEWNDLQVYNAVDCVEDARVWGGQFPWVGITGEAEWKTERVQNIYAHNKRLSQIAAKMHGRGIEVNQFNKWVLDVGLQEEFSIRVKALREAVGIPMFEMNPDHLRAILFKRHETENLKRFSLPDPFEEEAYTETNKISVGQGQLLMLVQNPAVPDEAKNIIELWWRANAPRKARSTYVTSKLVSESTGVDGRLRAGWNCHGADTRWSCSEPNLQNISVEKKD